MRLLSRMNNGQAYCLSAHCHLCDTRSPAQCRERAEWQVFSLISSLPSSLSADVLAVFVRMIHRCRVGGGAPLRWPPSAAQTARTVFPYAAFTKTQTCRDAREGINPIKFTSPYSRYRVVTGSCFHPPLRRRLIRCDQIRRTIQRSSWLKSIRTWARL